MSASTSRLAQMILFLRECMGQSQIEFAKECGVSQTAVSFWERAKAVPHERNMHRLNHLWKTHARPLLAQNNEEDFEWPVTTTTSPEQN